MRLALSCGFDEALGYLGGFSKQGAPVKDLSRFSALMRELDEPFRGLKTIHITGTNGKGSVAEYCARALSECGFRAGRFTSPYIVDIRERITADGRFISREDFSALMAEVSAAVMRCEDRAFSRFELLTAVCFLYFARQRVDYCVIEAGIGGTLDCTNIIEPPAVSVITSIGLDHTAILGGTHEEIARSKAGIIKGNPATAAYGIPDGALKVIRERCRAVGSELIVPRKEDITVLSAGITGSEFLYKGEKYRISMGGAHQIENCVTAAEALARIPSLDKNAVRRGLERAKLPARLESISDGIILDGGHNPQAAEAARELLSRDSREKTALIGMIGTKDYRAVLDILLPCFREAVFVDGFFGAVPAETLCGVCGDKLPCRAAHSPAEGLSLAKGLTRPGELLFCGGSLYLAAELRGLLGKEDA